jgi:hypothetical protein
MKPTHLGRTTAVLLLVLVSGPLATLPLGAAPVPKEAPKEELYFPIKKGTKWVYDQGKEEKTEVVTAVEHKPKEKVWIVAVDLMNKDGKAAGKEKKWEVSNQGLVSVTPQKSWVSGEIKPRSLQHLKLPHVAGEKWAADMNPEPSFRSVTLDKQKVKVPAGEFEAIGVETYLGDKLVVTRWYAPGVGLVRIGDEKNPTYVLKSFTPGKD